MAPPPYQHYRNLLPLAVLLVACVYTVANVLTTQVLIEGQYYDRSFSWQHYAGFAAVAVCLGSYFAFRPFFKYAVTTTLLLGLVNLLYFTPDVTTVGLGFDEARLTVQLLPLLLLLAYYFLSQSVANRFIRRHILPAPSAPKAARFQREEIDQFKQNFARKTDESLHQIVQERQLVGNAITAAQELLQDRRK